MSSEAVSRLMASVCVLAGLVGPVYGQQPPEPSRTFQVVRVVAGPRGVEAGGRFQLEQERTTFNRSRDTQIVVQFEWDGTPGLHRLAARWRSPAGDQSISEIEYTARDRRFGANWTLPISPSTPLGAWSIDATIDGLPAGALTFEIDDAELPAAAARTRPSPSELYQRLDSSYMSLVRLASRDGVIDRHGAFVIGPSSIVTAFSAIDAADSIELATADGRRLTPVALAAWDRRQDWVVIAETLPDARPLPLAPADSADVGDRCYSMESGATGARVLAECTIVGRNRIGAGGERLVVQFFTGRGMPGAPVVNEYGEVIGLLGGATSMGATTLAAIRAGAGQSSLVVPASAIRPAGADTVAIQDLRRRGVLMGALNGRDNILSGGFARQMQKNPVRPIDQRDAFTPADRQLSVFLNWDPRQQVRGSLVLRTYDDNGQLLAESKQVKINLKPGSGLSVSQWQLPVPARAGTYRVDVLFDAVPIWRGAFQVMP